MSASPVPVTVKGAPIAPRRPQIKKRQPRISDGRRWPVTVRKVSA